MFVPEPVGTGEMSEETLTKRSLHLINKRALCHISIHTLIYVSSNTHFFYCYLSCIYFLNFDQTKLLPAPLLTTVLHFKRSMYTIPIESSYVNAAVYIFFDVLLVIILSATFSRIQSANVLQRVSSGQRVKINESPLRHIAGQIRTDGTKLWVFLSVIQVLVLLLLFAATLGINGRTDYMEVLTSRQYVTTLPLDDKSFQDGRSSPPLFSSCVVSEGKGFNYFPAAFNTLGSNNISDFQNFQDEYDNPVKIDVLSIICQNTSGFTPILKVVQCGRGIEDCSNFNESSVHELKLIGNSFVNHSLVWGGRTGSWALWSHLDVPAGIFSETGYNYLMCSTEGIERPSSGNSSYLCTAGAYDIDRKRYTFRIGKIEFPVEVYDAVHDRKDANATVSFNAFSTQAEIEYDILKGGVVIVSTLARLNYKAKPVSTRMLLDFIVNRFTACKSSGNTKLYELRMVAVTDVSIYSASLYAILLGGTICAWIAGAVYNQKHGAKQKGGHICTDLTTYEGLARLLRYEQRGFHDGRGLELGLVRNEASGMLRVAVLDREKMTEALSSDGMIECCVEELSAIVEKQANSAMSSEESMAH